jgi:cobalt-zinc-cadmium efflux system membrane fusion protein
MHLWVSLDATEATLRDLKPGMLLLISSSQFPDETFAGELRQLADFVDPTTRTLKLRGDVGNADRRLKAEMFVTARIKVPPGEYPTVNARAVYLEGVRRYVFVRMSDGTYVRRAVRVGAEDSGRMPVLAGLREGEEVVVAGNLYLAQLLGSVKPGAGDVAAK